MMTVLERYPCGKGNGKSKGRMFVYYLYKCDCGKKFIVGGDELSKHPYSCGCTPKPKRSETGRPNDWALGYDKDKHTMTYMTKKERAVYITSKSSVSGVRWVKQRNRWVARITYRQKEYFLGYFMPSRHGLKVRRNTSGGNHQRYILAVNVTLFEIIGSAFPLMVITSQTSILLS